ncbi:hypothetical protein BH24ACT22_BH24ACT22_02690 [soil metagenome]
MGRRVPKRGKKPGGVQAGSQDGSMYKGILIIGGVVVAVAGLMVVLAIMSQQPGQAVESLGNEHIESVNAEHKSYNTNPPTSGPHTEEMAPWGVSTEPVSDENQIHNLEDGGIAIQYGDDVEPGEVRALATIMGDYETVILAPRPTLSENQIAVTAWGRIMRLDSVDEDKIRDFINTFEGQDHHAAG